MKKICVFTSTRADFGILRPLLEELKGRQFFQVDLFVTGTHLSREHGSTLNEIEAAGFFAKHKVDIFAMKPMGANHSHTMGVALQMFGEELLREKYDLAVILGDRFEALSFGLACFNQQIPVAHIHGGEVTTGALDDGYRHALTKLSHVHFPCAEVYAQRIIRMGEQPSRVFNVGALAIDNIKRLPLLSKEEVESSLGKKLREKFVLMTFHPETTSVDYGLQKLENIIVALKDGAFKDWSILLTGTNNDGGSERVREKLAEWMKSDSRVVYEESLGAKRYFSIGRFAQAVIGNSSSGILEVPSLNVPTVNVGTRQDGRLRSVGVIDVAGDNPAEIISALNKAQGLKLDPKRISAFGDGTAAVKIADILQKMNFEMLLDKGFYDGQK